MSRHRWHEPEPARYHTLGRLASAVVRLHVDLHTIDAHKLPARGPALVCANHTSHLDPVVHAVALYRLGRKPRFLALAELFDKPAAGWALRTARMIPVHRGAGPEPLVRDAATAASEAMLDAVQALIPQARATAGVVTGP